MVELNRKSGSKFLLSEDDGRELLKKFESATEMCAAGVAFYKSGDFSTARKIMEIGMIQYPNEMDRYNHPLFRKELVRLLLSSKSWEEAKEYVKTNESWPDILFARAYSAAGAHELAEPFWKSTLQNDNSNAEAREALFGPIPVQLIAKTADLYKEVTDKDRAKSLFQTYINNIQLETSSYCNRKCSYCPNSLHERAKGNTDIKDVYLARVLNDLKEIKYRGRICLNLYNEPTSNPRIIEQINLIKSAAPHAFLYFNSNGDYINKEYLVDLYKAGLNKIIITLHTAPGQVYEHTDALSRLSTFSARTGLSLTFREVSKSRIATQARVRGLEIEVNTCDYSNFGQTRGDALRTVRVRASRHAPCQRVFFEMTIAYDGELYPCCQLASSTPEQRRYSMGNLLDYPDLFRAFTNREFSAWRRGLASYGEKGAPCTHCTDGDHSGHSCRDARHNAKIASLVE